MTQSSNFLCETTFRYRTKRTSVLFLWDLPRPLCSSDPPLKSSVQKCMCVKLRCHRCLLSRGSVARRSVQASFSCFNVGQCGTDGGGRISVTSHLTRYLPAVKAVFYLTNQVIEWAQRALFDMIGAFIHRMSRGGICNPCAHPRWLIGYTALDVSGLEFRTVIGVGVSSAEMITHNLLNKIRGPFDVSPTSTSKVHTVKSHVRAFPCTPHGMSTNSDRTTTMILTPKAVSSISVAEGIPPSSPRLIAGRTATKP